MSGRTLARRFDAELGMSLRSWRRLRLFKAIEMLGGGQGVTETAMALGCRVDIGLRIRFPRPNGCPPGVYTQRRERRAGLRTACARSTEFWPLGD